MTAQAAPEFRAAGTDLSERRRSGVSKGPLVDIATGGDTSITWAADGAATIGAFATIAAIAADTCGPSRPQAHAPGMICPTSSVRTLWYGAPQANTFINCNCPGSSFSGRSVAVSRTITSAQAGTCR